MAKDDGGPAFPVLDDSGTGLAAREFGMSLRDYFAAQALPQAIQHERDLRACRIDPGEFRYDGIATAAYAMADAMIAARQT